MKKLYAIVALGMLASCAMTKTMSDTSDIKACLMQAAEARVADGSAFAAPVRTTVKAMLNACLVGDSQTSEWMPVAQGILTALMEREGT